MFRRGFTLLEVLISLAVFALAAVVLGGAYVNVLNAYATVADAARQDEDVRFARQAVFLEPDREKLEEGGDFETTDGRRVAWRVQIEPTNVADLFTVIFTCETGATDLAGRPETVVETFRLLRPTWSEGTDRETLRKEASDRIQKLQGTLK